VIDNIQRVRYREGYDKPVAWLQKDKVYKVTLQPMQTSDYFAAGHQLRIEVSSSNFPRYDRNLNTGGSESLNVTIDGYTFNLDQTRTVKSITLPNNSNLILLSAVLANAPVSASLGAYYNRAGIYTDGTTFSATGGIDGGVAIRIGHLLERNAKLATAPDAAGSLRFENLAPHEGAQGDGHSVVDGDGVGRFEINGITRLGGPRVDAVAQE